MSVLPLRLGRPAYGPRDRIVVVGGGAAGWSAAAELRRLGFPGAVDVLTAEPIGPYDRTACSKGLLTGQQRPQDTALDLRCCPGVTWRPGSPAVGLDPLARRVALADGTSQAYDGLVLATGSRPELPPEWPARQPGLHLLHDLTDAWALRSALADARRVAVVGGGLTGCEVACAVIGLAREAVVVHAQPWLMGGPLGEPVGRLVTAAHARTGIELALGRRVRHAHRRGNRWTLQLDDGGSVVADVVVVTTGERPDVGWLSGAGLDLTDGVACDDALRVRDAGGAVLDGVVAAGALARWPNLRHDTRPGRIGQWIAAIEQGRGAARTLLTGADAGGPAPVALLPRFWSDQHGLRIQVCGRIDPDADISLTELRPRRRDTARAGVVASYTERGRLTGVVAVNAPRAFTVACRSLLADPTLVAAPVRAAPREVLPSAGVAGQRHLRAMG